MECSETISSLPPGGRLNPRPSLKRLSHNVRLATRAEVRVLPSLLKLRPAYQAAHLSTPSETRVRRMKDPNNLRLGYPESARW